jgi:tetratricopeptide (TPR) repeat protein
MQRLSVSSLLAGLFLCACSRTLPHDPSRDAASGLAYLERSEVKSVYFNAAALPVLLKAPPTWLAPADREPGSEHVRSLAQAAMTTKLFRQLDRQEHFDALLLAGDPVQFKPLSDHLLKTGDWTLDWVDAWCSIYRHGSASLSREKIFEIARQWDSKPSSERASALALMVERLVAASRLEEAGEMIQQATTADGSVASVWTAEGWYRLARGEWTQAIAAADHALKLNSKSRVAQSVKAQGLYFSKQFEQAYLLSRNLLEDAPEDPLMLFTHAKIAHEVGAIQEEVGVLRKLIGIAERERRPVSWYRVYLGQALALTGDGPGALKEFDLAQADPELPEEQRDFVKSARARVALHVKPKVR